MGYEERMFMTNNPHDNEMARIGMRKTNNVGICCAQFMNDPTKPLFPDAWHEDNQMNCANCRILLDNYARESEQKCNAVGIFPQTVQTVVLILA